MHIGKFRLGLRTIKSAVAVMICILVFHFVDGGQPLIAALAAVFSLRQDLSTSLSFGKSRILGNSLGGLLAIFYFVIKSYFEYDFLVELFLLPVLVALCIVISDGINNNSGIIASIATLLLISLSIPQGESAFYALSRVIETFIGTFIAIAINFFGQPKVVEQKAELEEDLAQLKIKEAALSQQLEEVRGKINQQDHEEK
ncbi:FUSC family protein [Enterococcus sp. HY326]|uniref:FUSC family protein n=1 Tax=Enterococcus sp. HY326 TaxID=2971265 RepID=UPI00223F3914|nr:FUSC family protein [Enterococcus sp. HY326]